MSADFEKLEERVAFLERELRRTSALIDFVEARADKSLVGMNEHLDKQDNQLQEFIQETRAHFGTLEQLMQETRQLVQEASTRLDTLEQSMQEANARLDALERLLQETRQSVQEITARLDRLEQAVQENTTRLGSLEQTVQETNTYVSSLAESVNKRFDHVYGKLADIDSNIVEMRDLLAFLVEKQK